MTDRDFLDEHIVIIPVQLPRRNHMELQLERRDQVNTTGVLSTPDGSSMIAFTPAIDEDYWAYRVRLSETQAIVGFPKFSTIGIGFAQEEDWNTNLPYTCETDTIFGHIRHNKGDDSIADADVIEAIRLVQEAAIEDRGA
jgi:hypothetical protein